MLGILLIIIIGIYFYNTNKKVTKLEEENLKLKKILKNISKKYDLNEFVSESSNNEINKTVTNTVQNNKIEVKQETNFNTVEKEKNEREKKNTNILITGALLIVLSAIVFLTSTWNAIPNILKAIVLVLLVGVFLGASKIAKEKFELKKTSNTFFYIAMAYIPICLLAFSIFELFGHYFSIFGEGKYIYLSIAMILNSAIYYFAYKSKKINNLLYGSILSQIFAVILFGLIFGNNLYLVSSILLIYNILLIFLSKEVKDADLLKYFYIGIPYIVGILAICSFEEVTIYMLFLLIALAINFYLLYTKVFSNLVNAYLFNISLFSIGLYFVTIYAQNLDTNLKVISGIIYIILILVIEAYNFITNKDEKIMKSAMVTSLISMTITYFWVIDLKNQSLLIKPFVVSLIETVLMLAMFIKSKQIGKKILGYLIPISLIITIFDIFNFADASYHFYIIASLMVFVLGELITWKEFEPLNKGFFIISNIVITLTYLFNAIFTNKFSNDVIYFILLEIVYAYSYIRHKYKLFKYLSYININFVLLSGIEFIDILNKNIELVVPVLVSLIVVLIESKVDYVKDAYSDIFSTILQIIAYYYLALYGEIQSVIIGMFYTVYLIYNNLKYNQTQYMLIVPLTGFIPVLLSSNIKNEYTTIILLLSTVVLTIMSIYKRKISITTFFSAIYLLFTIFRFDNYYISELLLLIWSISNFYFSENQYAKDIFKGVSYFSGLILYENFASDINLLEFKAFEVIGVTIFAILILRDIIIKYIKKIDTVEYFVYIIINIFALTSYVNEKDGMIYVLFLVGLLIYSYTKKYGVLFIVSMFTIIGNAILLTREFWLNVPWWIYLLLVGSILIAFAIKNESDEKKEKLGVGNIIKNIKDKIEK